jgi:hypothetical protein
MFASSELLEVFETRRKLQHGRLGMFCRYYLLSRLRRYLKRSCLQCDYSRATADKVLRYEMLFRVWLHGADITDDQKEGTHLKTSSSSRSRGMHSTYPPLEAAARVDRRAARRSAPTRWDRLRTRPLRPRRRRTPTQISSPADASALASDSSGARTVVLWVHPCCMLSRCPTVQTPCSITVTSTSTLECTRELSKSNEYSHKIYLS